MGHHQPQWRLIDQTLDRIHAELIKHPAFTGTGGPNPGSMNYHVNWEKLDRAGRILKACLQNIKSSRGLLHVQSLAAKKIPREHRWSVNQSLKARNGNLDYVQGKAQNLLEMLEDMVSNYGGADLGSINKLMDQSSAVIAAWLPGTSGGQGIIDAIIGDYVIRPNGQSDKMNSLSFDWPKSAVI